MANTFAADLAAIKQDVWADLFYAGLDNRPILSNSALVERHDMRGASSDSIKFPAFGKLTAVQAADSVATTYQTVSPTATTATVLPYHVAISLSRFAQATTPAKSVLQFADNMMAAVGEAIENALVDESVAGPTQEVGADASAMDLAMLRAALALLNSNQRRNASAWLLNLTGEAALLGGVTDMETAGNFGAMVITEGAIGRLLGKDVLVSDFLAANRSALVANGTLHYAVVQEPEVTVAYSPDLRSDVAVVEAFFAVKYIPTADAKGVRIRHT